MVWVKPKLYNCKILHWNKALIHSYWHKARTLDKGTYKFFIASCIPVSGIPPTCVNLHYKSSCPLRFRSSTHLQFWYNLSWQIRKKKNKESELLKKCRSWKKLSKLCFHWLWFYSCNKLNTTQIQISRQNWNGFFWNISRQMMI